MFCLKKFISQPLESQSCYFWKRVKLFHILDMLKCLIDCINLNIFIVECQELWRLICPTYILCVLSLPKLSKSSHIEQKSFCIPNIRCVKNINTFVNGVVSNILVLAKVKPWLRLEALMAIRGKDYTTDERNGRILAKHPTTQILATRPQPLLQITTTWSLTIGRFQKNFS